jgi:transcriptional regulator with XRE-family HTH domain
VLTKYRQRQVLTKDIERLRRFAVGAPMYGWVKTFRYLFDLSQTDLARLLGVTQKRIDAIEESEVNGRIELATLNRIAKVFDSELYYIFIPKRPLEEIRKEVINKSYQQKYGCELKAIKATNSKISRLNLRGIYGLDPTLF